MKILLRYCIFLSLLAFSCNSKQSQVAPEAINLRTEYGINSLGLDVATPRLSWQMNKNINGAKQTAYQIMVSATETQLSTDKGDLWDSGKIYSDQSIQITYKGSELKSGQKAFWKVKIWDEQNQESAWSKTANWEIGLVNPADWNAHWIGAPESLMTGEYKNASPLFRQEATITKKIKSARAYISGLGYYELYINGAKIGDHVLSPNQTNYDRQKVEKWSESRIGNMNSTVLYETFDITSSLKNGANALGVILGNGWYFQADRPNDTMLWYDTPRLIAQFKIDYEDGSNDLITSDESRGASS